ncbi:MAG: putative DNA base hypermodification protein [Polyangiaceae bacterium]
MSDSAGRSPRARRSSLVFSRLAPVEPTPVYDTYWRFAAERQEIFFRRIERPMGLWTKDPILAQYKFTNTYRASDRVSQYLIRHVINEGAQSLHEIFFRTLLFKFFNRIETWKLLLRSFGEVRLVDYSFERYEQVLTAAMQDGARIYSAAYIMPAAQQFKAPRKHATHLRLLEHMLDRKAPEQMARAKSLRQAFEVLRAFPMMGDFLAYQFTIDINYSTITNFEESEFVVPGPGARDGIRKCFKSLGGLSEADVIRLVADRQEVEFERLGVQFRSLWGRPLQLVDCQNIFCETDKYARVAHPEAVGLTGRTRIKQVYSPTFEPIDLFYPPKWGINEEIAARSALARADQQKGLQT